MRKYRKPYRVKRKKSFFRHRLFLSTFSLCIFLAVIFYVFFFLEFFQIKKIILSGQERISAKELELIIQNKIEKRILFFSTKSIFLVNAKEIKNELLEVFPLIAEAELKRKIPDTIQLSLLERKELASWWHQEDCFLIDKEGIVFEKCFLEDLLVKLSDQKNNTFPILGEKIIEKEYLEKVLEIYYRLLSDEFEVKIAEIFIFSSEFHIKTVEGWKIYFNSTESLDWQLTKLSLVLEKEIPSEKRKELDYIELRFGNFAPYKYKK